MTTTHPRPRLTLSEMIKEKASPSRLETALFHGPGGKDVKYVEYNDQLYAVAYYRDDAGDEITHAMLAAWNTRDAKRYGMPTADAFAINTDEEIIICAAE